MFLKTKRWFGDLSPGLTTLCRLSTFLVLLAGCAAHSPEIWQVSRIIDSEYWTQTWMDVYFECCCFVGFGLGRGIVVQRVEGCGKESEGDCFGAWCCAFWGFWCVMYIYCVCGMMGWRVWFFMFSWLLGLGMDSSNLVYPSLIISNIHRNPHTTEYNTLSAMIIDLTDYPASNTPKPEALVILY